MVTCDDKDVVEIFDDKTGKRVYQINEGDDLYYYWGGYYSSYSPKIFYKSPSLLISLSNDDTYNLYKITSEVEYTHILGVSLHNIRNSWDYVLSISNNKYYGTGAGNTLELVYSYRESGKYIMRIAGVGNIETDAVINGSPISRVFEYINIFWPTNDSKKAYVQYKFVADEIDGNPTQQTKVFEGNENSKTFSELITWYKTQHSSFSPQYFTGHAGDEWSKSEVYITYYT